MYKRQTKREDELNQEKFAKGSFYWPGCVYKKLCFIFSKQNWNDLRETRLKDTLEDEVYISNEDAFYADMLEDEVDISKEDTLYVKDIYAKGQVEEIIFAPGPSDDITKTSCLFQGKDQRQLGG